MTDKYYNSKTKEYFQILNQNESEYIDVFVYDKNLHKTLNIDVFKRRCFPVGNVSSFVLKENSTINYKLEIFDNTTDNNIIDFIEADKNDIMLSVSEKTLSSSVFDVMVSKKTHQDSSDIDIMYLLKNKIFKEPINFSLRKNINNKNNFLPKKKNKQKKTCHSIK